MTSLETARPYPPNSFAASWPVLEADIQRLALGTTKVSRRFRCNREWPKVLTVRTKKVLCRFYGKP
jgi:hypothetical protein